MIGRVYRSLRLVVVAVLLLTVVLVAALYVGLSLPAVQNYACSRVEKSLSEMLGVRVGIRSLGITPFNRVVLRDIAVVDSAGDTVASAERLGAGISLTDFIIHHRTVVNYVEAVGLDLRLWRDSVSGPLNIAPIMARLSKPGGDGGVPDLRINAIVLRRSRASYDVPSAQTSGDGRLDPSHLLVDDIRADLRVNLDHQRRSIGVELSRFAARELRSGLRIDDMTAKALLTKAPAPDGAVSSIAINDLAIRLPGSRLSFVPTTVSLRPSLEIATGLDAGSHIALGDFSSLLPGMLEPLFGERLDMAFQGRYGGDAVELRNLRISDGSSGVIVDAPRGLRVSGLDSLAMASFALPRLEISLGHRSAVPFTAVHAFAVGGDAEASVYARALDRLLPLTISLEGDGDAGTGELTACLVSENAGAATVTADYSMSGLEFESAEARIELGRLKVADIVEAVAAPGSPMSLGLSKSLAYIPREVTATIECRAVRGASRIPDGVLSASVESVVMARRDGSDAELEGIAFDVVAKGGVLDGSLESANPGFALSAEASADVNARSGSFDLALDDLDLGTRDGSRLSLTATGDGCLPPAGSPLPFIGSVSLRDIVYSLPEADKRLEIKAVDLVSDDGAGASVPTVTLESDFISASLRGSIDASRIGADLRGLAASLFPDIVPEPAGFSHSRNDFSFEARLLTSAPLEKVFSLPVQVRYPVDISASLTSAGRRAGLRVEAPYLWQGRKEIDGTSLRFVADGTAATLAAATTLPTKNGLMDVKLMSALPAESTDTDVRRALSTSLSWNVDAARDFSGQVSFDITPCPDPEQHGSAMALISFLPGNLAFNDTVWTMDPSEAVIRKGRIEVDGFRVGRAGQHIEIDGAVTAANDDSLAISLADVDLDYVFETLNISNAMFGGTASGKLYASGLLGPDLRAYTPDLFVKGLKYNFSLMGDTHIRASFDPEAPAVNIDARVDQPNGRHSLINGYIKPTSEGYIDLDFKADRIEVGFMKPFMSAFASAVNGYASGDAHLFGTFHDVNMSGEIFAEDLSLTLDFTGCTYHATDSVRLQPGYIDLDGITLRDRVGHTAMLNGYLRHTNFHLPEFQFRITDARELLVYDLPESPDRRWYGTIYGNGAATVTGVPGHIDIGVEMTTARNSTFGFILSDAEEAYDYRFITFRDRNGSGDDGSSAAGADGVPPEVAEMRRALARKAEEESSSIYDMNINVAVTPDAQLTVVMDPVGGDAIRARGSGDMAMTYNSASEELGLRGDYTLDNGTYNFTFQDIIRKDFRINPGSTIRFTGDPYAAQLDIEAAYRLTANLSDLDESFLDDPELTRTSVPVDALINVTGDMRAPDIAYDFAFPTLKDDVKRKVNSIVSTDDMRARQMLYLLALNRFYTPEYMSATKGNELFSVASSTLSSQISNLLGSLAENWTIAPNIRSDRGDFSDVEFDLALSSSLLNNRLIFNGNFGYRDKSLNNNSFIGDFDLEYLLNRTGSLRLKAYNRYNDQNFYFKNALTTQGVGIVFRRDFDSFGSWLKALLSRKPSSPPLQPADSVTTRP